jgi:hypothetical protein
MMNTKRSAEPASTSPVQAARTAIWRLFEEGYVDEDMATASLLAVDLGTRRAQRRRVGVPATGQGQHSGADCRRRHPGVRH